MRRAHILGGMAVLLLGIATTVLARTTLPYSGDFGPGPGFLPFWLGIVLTACAVPLVVAELRAERTSAPLFRPETVKCAQVLCLIVAVFLAIPVLGFAASLALITGGGMRVMGKHGWATCALTVIGTAICIRLLFGQWLGIPLPKGMIGW